MKQQGIRTFLKAGNSRLEGQIGIKTGKRQEARGEDVKEVKEVKEVVEKVKEFKKEETEAVTPGKKSDKRASEEDKEVKGDKKYKMKVKEAKNMHAASECVKNDDKIGKTNDKSDKTKPEVKKQGKSVKVKALKPAKKPEKSIKPSKKVSEGLVGKITMYFKKKPDIELPDNEHIEEGLRAEEKEVETSQPEQVCQAPSSQVEWVGSSQIVPSLVFSVKNSSHVTHQMQQQQQQLSSCSNCDHLVTGQNGPCSNGCLDTDTN